MGNLHTVFIINYRIFVKNDYDIFVEWNNGGAYEKLYGKLVCFMISTGLVAGCDMSEQTSKREKKMRAKRQKNVHK